MPEPRSLGDAHTGMPDHDASGEKVGRDMVDILLSILDVLRKSSIANLDVIDPIQRFWKHYKTTADEFDDELLDKLRQDIDMSMIFAGLFSAVDATVISMTNANLSQDPNVVTQALLQSVVFSLNASAIATPLVPTIPVWNGPSATAIWVQSLLYISLACSLYAALPSMLGKQWLSHYRSVSERGDHKARGAERHRKFIGLEVFHLRTILGSIPLLLQASLLLFGLGSCAYVWDQQRIVGAITIVANGIGALCYFASVGVSVLYPKSPFQTPLTTILVRVIKLFSPGLQSCGYSLSSATSHLKSIWLRLLAAIKFFQQWSARCLRPLKRIPQRLFHGTRRLEDTSHANEGDVELAGKHPEDQPNSYETPIASDVTARESKEKYTEADEVLTSAIRWLSITTTDVQVQAVMWPIIPTVRWSPRAMQELPIEILDRIMVDIRSYFEMRSGGRLTLIMRYRDVAQSTIATFLFLAWEKLADSFVETKEWVRRNAHARGVLHALSRLSYPELPANNELCRLNLVLEATVEYFEEFAKSSIEVERSRRPLRPVVSIRSPSYTSADVIHARTMFYLAQQVTPPGDSTPEAFEWDRGELALYREQALRSVTRRVSDADSVPVLVVFALASAVAVYLRSPLPIHRNASTDTELYELLKLALQAVRDALKDLANTLCMPSQNTTHQGCTVTSPTKSTWLKLGSAQDLNHDLIISFLRSLDSLSVLLRRPDFPERDGLRDYIDSEILDVCLQMAVAVTPNAPQDKSSLKVTTIVGRLLLFGIPFTCCPYHEAGMDTTAACQVSGKRVPKRGAYKRLVSAAESAAQDFQALAKYVLKDYARDGVNAALHHYYSTMLLLNLPGLFSTTLRNSQTSWEHAINAIQEAALEAAKSEPSYKDSRMAAALIHSLLKPAPPGLSPAVKELVLLVDDAFCAGVQALLLKSCSEPFYKSADDFLGPDEIASDILLWLGGPSFEFADAQWDKMCMLTWLHIAKRALVSQYWTRENWQRPSSYLMRNLCRLIACNRLFGIESAVGGGSLAGEGGEQHAEGRNADGGDSGAEFWSGHDVRCAAVIVVELLLLDWRLNHHTDEDLTPDLILDRTARAVARLQATHVEEVKKHLEELKGHIQCFRVRPIRLFVWSKREDEPEEKEVEEYVLRLTVLEAMLTPLPEGAP